MPARDISRPPAAVQCALVARSRSRGSVTTVVASSLVFGIAALCVGCGDDAAEPAATGELIADPTSGPATDSNASPNAHSSPTVDSDTPATDPSDESEATVTEPSDSTTGPSR